MGLNGGNHLPPWARAVGTIGVPAALVFALLWVQTTVLRDMVMELQRVAQTLAAVSEQLRQVLQLLGR